MIALAGTLAVVSSLHVMMSFSDLGLTLLSLNAIDIGVEG